MRNKRFIAAAAIAGMLVGVPAASAAGSKLITGSDVKNGSLTAKDISPNTLESWKDFFKGDKGDTGPMGPIGLTGPQGVKGDDGAKGATGDRGPVGPAGVGINGADGANGEDGKPGADGAKGATGPQGEVGPAGKDGNTGPAGPVGPAGAAGANGVSGYGYVMRTNVNIADFGSDTVNCPAGKVAIGGGGLPSGAPGAPAVSLAADWPETNASAATGWAFKYNNGSVATLYAICIKA